MTPFTLRPRRSHSTIEALQRAQLAGDLERLEALGLALHHFTAHLHLRPVTAHHATTVLTRQIEDVLPVSGVAGAASLVLDPERPALPGGHRVAALEGWLDARADIEWAVHESIVGVATYGELSIRRLAAARALASREPWWRSPAWDELSTRWWRERPGCEVELATLRDHPESVRDTILEDILQGGQRRPADHPAERIS